MSQGLAGWSVAALAESKARIASFGAHLAQAPGEWQRLAADTHAALMSGSGVRGFTYFAILLFVGIGAEWLYWTYAYSPLRALESIPAGSPRQALRLALRRLALAGSGLCLFTIATIGASTAFAWPPGVQELVIAATLLVLTLRFSWGVVAAVLAPGRPRLRLVPVAPEHVRSLAGLAMTVTVLLALAYFVPDFLQRVAGAPHVAAALRFAALTAAALLLAIGALAFFGRRSRAQAARFPKSFVLALLAVAVYALWLMNATAAALGAIVAIVIALQIGLRALVFFFWPGDAERTLASIVLSASRFLVVLLGLAACATVLDTPVVALAAEQSPMLRFALRVLGVATLALLVHVIWIAIRSAIDRRLGAIRPAGPHHRPDASSRLLTLLPLLRVTAAVLLFVMLVLSSLWALGIEITPVLAGAGVAGLAIGFGAQALVRDVIAGVFFLAEDAFRIGEYIEAGSSTKGTVERITLRTVALRHHNGPLHFVPYGSLGTVRNNSRDWVIDKFNLPLPIDADSEKIRKLIKKVGEEMKADPELGALMLEPLRGKLYRVDPGVKIFRCKFQTPPGMQFDVRAAAYKRIEAALAKLGIGFADGRTLLVSR